MALWRGECKLSTEACTLAFAMKPKARNPNTYLDMCTQQARLANLSELENSPGRCDRFPHPFPSCAAL